MCVEAEDISCLISIVKCWFIHCIARNKFIYPFYRIVIATWCGILFSLLSLSPSTTLLSHHTTVDTSTHYCSIWSTQAQGLPSCVHVKFITGILFLRVFELVNLLRACFCLNQFSGQGIWDSFLLNISMALCVST